MGRSSRWFWRVEPWAVHVIMLGPFCLAVAAALVLVLVTTEPSAAVLTALALYATGAALFVTAKLSVFRKGILLSFGPRHMSRPFRALCFLGYALMAAGLLLTVLLLSLHPPGTAR